jgi:fructose-bisphosphate aldolase class II
MSFVILYRGDPEEFSADEGAIKMSLINLTPWLQRARREHFAIGAFNANTLEQAQAAVMAAEKESAPVFIQISHRALLYAGDGSSPLGLCYMAAIGQVAAGSVSVPVALHLDHGTTDEVLQALELGFTSVMFDGAHLSLEENIESTSRLVEAAHARGIGIEGVLAEVSNADSESAATQPRYTSADEAAEFALRTGIDSLGISVGSVQALKEKERQLDLERLEAIAAVVEIPLVLHGASGVVDEAIAAGIVRGIAKVGVATQLNQAFTGAVRDVLGANPAEVDPRKYLAAARLAYGERARERIRFLGSSGKAA